MAIKTWTLYTEVIILALAVSASGQCPNGYHSAEGSICLRIADSEQPWETAQIACKGAGDRLLEITSLDKHERVLNFLRNRYADIDNFWLGANDRLVDGTFEWLDKTYTRQYMSWCSRPQQQPNGKKAENCLKMTRSCDFKFSDDNCLRHFKFICETTPKSPAVNVDNVIFSSAKYLVEILN